ncbi:hypothetical protein GQ43DRAFT_376663 [Delitschia confertaspora ATCC 74209]|uniref:PXA domain-containing protein n=1 Tax=Delitschia confertaspora ATCC 74209 TaxID=1513339 RepID=A0A9P4JH01_9PLEO|nr:hypothetical protein GQ43DRAFT_376663 [Delitschia confertaspora ATCC 74209]
MTESIIREPSFPHIKPSAPSKSTQATSGANIHTKPTSRQTEAQKPSDTTSDKATAAFIRRTLCFQNASLGNSEKARNSPRPIEELLPPLTSSNDVDLQLYAIISVIVKEFIQTWYSKLTPDQTFGNEVIQIIAHCTRALEQRLRKIDLEALLLDEIPELVEAHLNAFHLAKQQTLYHKSLISNPCVVYHTLHPHPALSPVPTESVPSSVVEQRENESAWRQLLVQGLLAVLLPTEDLGNGCLRALVAEIFAEMILGNGISNKACEGWLLYEAITRIAEVLQDGTKETEASSNDTESGQTLNRLERYGLLAGPSDDEKPPLLNVRRHEGLSMAFTGMFWLVIQYAFLAFGAIRAVIICLARSSSLPSRSVTGAGGLPPVEAGYQSLPQHPQKPSKRSPGLKRPIVSMKAWSCASRVVELELRMPWLSGLLSMLHWGVVSGPGRVGDTDGVLDR